MQIKYLLIKFRDYPKLFRNLTVGCIMISSLLLISSCEEKNNSEVWSKAETMIEDDPGAAVDYLENIDVETLPKKDTYLYDLLLVKARDRAYIDHTSDSLIMEALNHYQHHTADARYPEALYYAGRVYADIGDAPMALEYFQKAHDAIKERKKADNNLLSAVLSQTGSLMVKMCLYKPAERYILEAIRLDSILQDSINLMYDLGLMGELMEKQQRYPEAIDMYVKGHAIALSIDSANSTVFDFRKANALNRMGETDSALRIVRKSRIPSDKFDRDYSLSRASEVYLWAGILDTAYMYAHELIKNPNAFHRYEAVQLLLDPNLKNFVPEESLRNYTSIYRKMIMQRMKQREDDAFLTQNAYYNYSQREKKQKEAEQRNEHLKEWLSIVIVLLLISVIILLIGRLRYKNTRVYLQDAIMAIESLRQQLIRERGTRLIDNSTDEYDMTFKTNSEYPTSGLDSEISGMDEVNKEYLSRRDNDTLRKELREKLLILQKNKMPSINPPDIISESDVYKKNLLMIKEKKYLSENSPIWEELESVVEQSSNGFKNRLRLLTGYNLTLTDLHMALLVKCHISPSDMVILVGKAKGTISSRRGQLCQKVFDEKMGVKVIDNIIRLL